VAVAITPRPTGVGRGALAGLVAAGVALGVAEIVTAASPRLISPVVAVGGWVIDHVPPSVKTFAIETFGSNDKDALVIGTTALLAVFAAVIGAVATRRRRIGWAGVAVFGLVGALAAWQRPGADALAALPSVLGAVAAGVVLDRLVRPAAPTTTVSEDRRRFLLSGGAAIAAAAAGGGLGRALKRRFDVAAARDAIVLPAPSSPAPALPAGIDPAVPGLTSFVTPANDFYRVDTALLVPQVDPSSWRLRVRGMVEHPLELSYDDLLRRRLVERHLTLVCVSNEVGGSYAGTARWLGVPLAEVLHEACVRDGATQLVSRSVDGFTAGTPVAAVLDGRDALLAVGMNGAPLPTEHGFPVRLVVPGLYGYVSATKWVTELELTTFEAFDPYWVRRGWAKQAPVKTFSRIDTPRGLQRVTAGTVPIAGVAWATHRGIDAVEVRIDDGPWRRADLAPAASVDTWRQWVLPWDATPGSHTITCRATDGTGATQPSDRVPPIPDGATGWHQIVVLVS
jgi:DMSO/TMAO reductase YedYZ molybdopterin-dependent catalytic subunit